MAKFSNQKTVDLSGISVDIDVVGKIPRQLAENISDVKCRVRLMTSLRLFGFDPLELLWH